MDKKNVLNKMNDKEVLFDTYLNTGSCPLKYFKIEFMKSIYEQINSYTNRMVTANENLYIM